MFKRLITMDPATVRELLDGQEDSLSAEIKSEEALYRNTQCPVCGKGSCEKRLRSPKVAIDGDGVPHVVSSPFGLGMLPEGYAHCINCNTDFNPYTGMIFRSDASMIHAPE